MVIDARGNTIKETRDNIATIMKAHGSRHSDKV